MSFPSPTAETATIDDDIKQLRDDIEKFSKLDASDPDTQQAATRTVNDLRGRVTQLEANGPQVRDQVLELKAKIDTAAAAYEVRVQEAEAPPGPDNLPPDMTQEQLQAAREQEQLEHLKFMSREADRIQEETNFLNKLYNVVGGMYRPPPTQPEDEDQQKKTCVVA
jgi:chromosome segregation ATPase